MAFGKSGAGLYKTGGGGLIDADVENSDASYTDTVESGGTLVLPDSDVNVNSSLEGTVVSVKAIDINLTDGASTVTPTSVSVSGNVVDIEVPAAGGAPVGATLMKTGQTTSYRTGDDGDLEAGRATDFFTLASNNPFGNTNRFTDELGGTAYTNDIVIDWSTYDGSTVLGWYRVENGVNINWNDSIDNALLTSIGTFTSGWRLPNMNEIASIINWESIYLLNYAPFNNNTTFTYWTSTTRANNTGRALAFLNNGYQINNYAKTTISGTQTLVFTNKYGGHLTDVLTSIVKTNGKLKSIPLSAFDLSIFGYNPQNSPNANSPANPI